MIIVSIQLKEKKYWYMRLVENIKIKKKYLENIIYKSYLISVGIVLILESFIWTLSNLHSEKDIEGDKIVTRMSFTRYNPHTVFF